MKPSPLKVGVLTVSDRAAAGTYEDLTGPAVQTRVETWEATSVVCSAVVADDRVSIADRLRTWAQYCDLVLTNGGTGLGPRDVTPEATLDVVTRQVPGIAELMRTEGLKATRLAALSRQVAGQLDNCLIVNLPGSPNGAIESLVAVETVIRHACAVIIGSGH